MINRPALMVIVILISILAGGCWDRREIEDIGVIHAVAIEPLGDDRVRVIFQYINTSVQGTNGGGGKITFEKPYRNRVIDADSLYDAIKQLPHTSVARRFFAHTELLIVSEEFARQRGLEGITDYVTRDPQFLPRTWLLVGRHHSMADLLDTAGVIAPIPTQRIKNMLMQRKKVSDYAPLRLGEFAAAVQSEAGEPYTAVVEVRPNPSPSHQAEGYGYPSGEVPEPLNTLVINGTALFRGDNMEGWLDQDESRGMLWLRGEVKEGQIRFPLPDNQSGTISTEIIKARTEVHPLIEDGTVVLKIRITADTSVEEVSGYFPMEKESDIEKLQTAQNQAVLTEAQAALTRVQQELQLDVLGFGEAIHRKYPKQWQQIQPDWAFVFPAVAVELEVKTNIRRTNLSSRPEKVKEAHF